MSAAVPLSFGSPGHALRKLSYDEADLDVDLSGRLCIVTGANSGIGRAASLALAARGARVILVCRNEERGRVACEQLCCETGSDLVELAVVDLSRERDVRGFCASLQGRQIDVLIHSAASVPENKTLSDDGIETSFATNVVGPFLMTGLLLDRLQASSDARVIFVSSGGMYLKKLSLEDWSFDRTAYDPVIAYANTKRAVVILSELLADRFRGTTVSFNSMHPGWANTPLVESSLPTFHALARSILRTPQEASDTTVWLAIAPRLAGETGKFWFDRQARRTHALGLTKESEADRDALWRLVTRLARLDPAGLTPSSQMIT